VVIHLLNRPGNGTAASACGLSRRSSNCTRDHHAVTCLQCKLTWSWRLADNLTPLEDDERTTR